MMKHAFLIVAHANPRQVGQLISLLDDPRHDIYLHIDRRAEGFDNDALRAQVRASKLHIYREYAVYWGDFSQVQAPLCLLKHASENNQYDYYHILSGMDLPLWTNDRMNAFFAEHPGRLFLSARELAAPKDAEKIRRTKVYHLLTKQRGKSKAYVLLDRALIAIQLALRVNRLRGETWQIMYGSNWASLPHDFVRCVCAHEEKIHRLFSKTNNADELYLQTVARNCGFLDRVYVPTHGERVNLHYTDWNRGNGKSPYTFRSEDFEALTHVQDPFARKFSEAVDREIIEKLIARLQTN